MSTDRTLPIIAVISLLVIALPSALFFRKLPAAELKASEKELITFSNQPVAMSSRRPETTFSGLISPVRAASGESGSATGNSAGPVPAPKGPVLNAKKVASRSLSSLPAVSVIYYAGSTRMAIVDDHVVREGSPLAGGVIVKIEETRVLMRKAGKDIWLTTE